MKASTPFVIMALILTVSCATTPSKTSGASSPTAPIAVPTAETGSAVVKQPLPPPDWTTKTNYVDGSNLVFVVSGPERSDVTSLAFQAMTGVLNLPVKPATPAAAAQATQKFLKQMSSVSPTEHFSRDGHGWWKIVVGKAEWDTSQAQLASLFQVAPPDPVAEMEKTGDEALQQGRYVDAVNLYVNAASLAVAGTSPRTERFQSALAKAQAVLSQFTLSSSASPPPTQAGKPFDSTFDVKLHYGTDPQAPAVSGAPLRFSYKTKVNGHLVMTGQPAKTDVQGAASLTMPVPDFGAKDNIVVMIDVNPWLEALAKSPQNLRDSVAKLEPFMADKKILLPYTVESASKQVPMVVALADLDERGSVERRQETTAALIAALKDSGFQASGLSINLSLLKSSNENVVLTAWRFQGKTTGRAVYGTVSLVSVTSADSQFNAEVSGTVKVVDLATSKPVYQYKNSKIASASDRSSAVIQGFRQWASDAAAAMTADLP